MIFSVRTSLEITVGIFKDAVAQSCDVLADQQWLVYKCRILKDDQALESYGFPQTDPAPAPITTHAANNTPAVTRGVGSNDGLFPGFGSNALVRGGAPGLFGTGLPELDQMQQQLTQNPDMIREIMNMPAVKNLMNNPELRHGLITRNLQMHELMYWNPEVAHILNDANIGSCKKPQTHA